MNRNQWCARWLVKHQSIDSAVAQKALAQAQRKDQDILELLQRSSLLKAEVAQQCRGAWKRQARRQSPAQSSKRRLDSSLEISDPLSSNLEHSEIGSYSIKSQIGQGGMGTVFLAQRLGSGAEVVLKTLKRMDGQGKRFQRFRREALTLAQLSHPNIVRIHEFNHEAQSAESGTVVPFLVMERVEGRDFQSIIDEHFKFQSQPPEPGLWIERLQKIAEALAYCHERGVTHRDIKPSNILLEDDSERPVLVDFGLVKVDAERMRASLELASLTKTGQILGSPAFAAPEQLFGQIDKHSDKTDVWGFAATLYYCLSGEVPYKAARPMELLAMARKRDPVSLKQHAPAVPPWVDDLCVRCLRREPESRPSMAEVAEAMQRRERQPSRALWPALGLALGAIVALLLVVRQMDREPPVLSVEQAQIESKSETVIIKGQVRDAAPFRVVWKVGKSRKERAVGREGRFTLSLNLPPGRHIVGLYAEDRGQLISQRVDVTVIVDLSPLELLRFDNEQESYADTVEVSGALSKGGCSLLQQGQTSALRDRTFRRSIKLAPGINQFQWVFVDTVGNRVTKTFSVKRLKVYSVGTGNSKAEGATLHFKSIQEALQYASEKTRILIQPGSYRGKIDISKTVQLIGLSQDQAVTLQNRAGTTLTVRAPSVLLRGLTIHAPKNEESSSALRIERPATVVEDCIISSARGNGVFVTSGRIENANFRNKRALRMSNSVIYECRGPGLAAENGVRVLVENCRLHSIKKTALLLMDRAQVSARNCLIEKSGFGVGLMTSSRLELKDCRVLQNQGEGLWMEEGSQGQADGCVFVSNGQNHKGTPRPNVNALSGSTLKLRRCKIQKGFGVGVLSQDRATIWLEGCSLADNVAAGLAAVKRGEIIHKNCHFSETKSRRQFFSDSGGKIRVQ